MPEEPDRAREAEPGEGLVLHDGECLAGLSVQDLVEFGDLFFDPGDAVLDEAGELEFRARALRILFQQEEFGSEVDLVKGTVDGPQNGFRVFTILRAIPVYSVDPVLAMH